MLVFSRKKGQGILIGEDIFIEVRQIDRKRVGLSICAPKSVHILRGELQALDSSVLGDEQGISESMIDTVIMRDVPTLQAERL